jgi:hypothetical protein
MQVYATGTGLEQEQEDQHVGNIVGTAGVIPMVLWS